MNIEDKIDKSVRASILYSVNVDTNESVNGSVDRLIYGLVRYTVNMPVTKLFDTINNITAEIKEYEY